MTIPEGEILKISSSKGFNPIMVEKVLYLIQLLQSLSTHPFLREKWVLKGGTALNLFIFDLPRLSVDIDLNYIGFLNQKEMLLDRPKIEQACKAVFNRAGFLIKRIPTDYAGGKWVLSYKSYTGHPGNLEVDINFMYRLPLFEIDHKDSMQLGDYQATHIPILNINELAAGKIAALLARSQARDLYDVTNLFRKSTRDDQLLRIAFIVYGGMNRVDWRTVSQESISNSFEDIGRKLRPVLRMEDDGQKQPEIDFGKYLVRKCREGLYRVLPLTSFEKAFLDRLLDGGIIDASLLTDNRNLQDRIQNQPLLKWKALNVKSHLKKTKV